MEAESAAHMILGIDIGGTTTKLGLVKDGVVLDRARIATIGHTDEHRFADAIAEAARVLIAKQVGSRLDSVGIGAPNANQLTGIIEMAPNLPWKHDVPLATMLTERLGTRGVLGNDANAAALGEWRYGAGIGFTDLLVVTLGTGVGSGFIVHDRLVLGSAGNAGELGHTTLVMDGRPCTCGRAGCLEAYVSIRGMRQTYADLGGDAEVLKVDGVKPIAEAAMKGDQEAHFTFQWTAQWLAVGLANAVAITGPGRIVLFGGITQSGELLMAPLQTAFRKALLNIYQGRVDLVFSALPDDDAALLGAAALTTL
ncbi:MAG TPA: ROK family protein [Flavobacteriales bacterium]|jgi:glucokinase|nr:ROK family protein [Flavobacteriales bacterium]MBK7481461.1 ROK family protein [Flavobacteriales bacterium]MBK8707238.1 ROK family protein [Flavobacteriales bacterium]MBK9627840.1 ROK family protein [Flavobacteriales bacterium]HQW98595.1 ROK family protein [Flavobacteriales bacterium]